MTIAMLMSNTLTAATRQESTRAGHR